MELNAFPYILRRSIRRRSIALTVDAAGAVRVAAPFFAPRPWIERVVQRNWSWVLRKQAQAAETRAQRPAHAYLPGEQFPVWGIPLELAVHHQVPRKKAACAHTNETLDVFLPTSTARKIPAVKDLLRDWFFEETERRLAAQLPLWAAQMGVTYQTSKVVNQKSRWGSCSRQGNLRFNGRLSLFSPNALEYVIVHELAHLKEANHSARFWAVVASVLPDFKERRRLLSHNAVKNIIHFV